MGVRRRGIRHRRLLLACVTLALAASGPFTPYAGAFGGSPGTLAALLAAGEGQTPETTTLDFESGLAPGQMIVGSLPDRTGIDGPAIGTVSIDGVDSIAGQIGDSRVLIGAGG